jgi:hypothetical protein
MHSFRITLTTRPSWLPYTLFGLFELLTIASLIYLWRGDLRGQPALGNSAGICFWFSFVALLATSCCLRKTMHRLAVIGWLTLLAAFLIAISLPAV